MDRKITELDSIEQIQGDEYFVIASKQYNENYKVKVSNFIDQMDFITVDDELSLTSTNPVQNRVITEKLNELDDRLDNLDGGNDSSTNFDLVVASVETETLPAGKQANVEITDLGTVDNVKSLAFSFAIPKGADGAGGSGDGYESFGYRTVFAFKHNDTKPSKPVGGSWDPVTNIITYPSGWSASDALERPVWMSNATFDSEGIVTDWSDPICISGEDGEDGADGAPGTGGGAGGDGSDVDYALEFIYKQTEKETSPGKPSNDSTVNDFVPVDEGWDDHPNGVGYIDDAITGGKILILCEWVCTRSYNKSTGVWSDWDGPVLWSKYGANGKDGDGVEYVYTLTEKHIRPYTPDGVNAADNSPTTNFQDREFIPAQTNSNGDSNPFPWTDNPSDVTLSLPYQWVSIRKFDWSTQLWEDFQEPTLWAKYGKDGDVAVATFKSFVFRRTNAILTESDTPTGGNYANPIPTNVDGNGKLLWSDGIPSGTEIVWMSSRIFAADDDPINQTSWTTPKQLTDTADFEVIYSPQNVAVDPPALKADSKDGAELTDDWKNQAKAKGWYDNPDDWNTSTNAYEGKPAKWMATNKANNGVWQGWRISQILGEKGDAGTSIRLLGAFDSYEALIQAWNDGLLPKEPEEVGDCYSVNGTLYVFDGDSWVNGGGIKGEQGPAGNGIMNIICDYAVTSVKDVPDKTNDDLWYTSSPATDETNKYLWKRTQIIYTNVGQDDIDNVVFAELVGVHGDKGIDGETTEYIFFLSNYPTADSIVVPTKSDPISTNNPGEWTDDPQGPGIHNGTFYKYEYVCSHVKAYNETSKEMEWGAYGDASLWATYGEDGRSIDHLESMYMVHEKGPEEITTGELESDDVDWYLNSPAANNTKRYLWKRTRIYFDKGDPSDYTYECIGVYGEPGVDGEAIQFAFKLTEKNEVPDDRPTDETEGTNTPGEWTDDAQMLGNYDSNNNWVADNANNVAKTYKFQWVSQRTKTVEEGSNEGKWGDWSTPTLWAELYPGMYFHIKYSNDGGVHFTDSEGEDVGKYIGVLIDYKIADSTNPSDYTWSKFLGDDGFYREYIFRLVKNENGSTEDPNTVAVPTSNDQTEQFVPSGWSADPLSPTKDQPYCVACHRDYGDGKWSEWKGNSTTDYKYAYIFSMYAESVKGDPGQSGPIVYPAGYWEAKVYTPDVDPDDSTVILATPYVYDVETEKYYVLRTTASNANTRPSVDSINWLEMSTFQAIYTDILVTPNALVGQAVFNGDYMFSQNGIDANGDELTDQEYKEFVHDDPYGENNSFRPNWCVNLVTGEMWTGAGGVYMGKTSSDTTFNVKSNYGEISISQSGFTYKFTRDGKVGGLSVTDDYIRYVGVSADQTSGGTKSTEALWINADGSGSIANGNIAWDASGNITKIPQQRIVTGSVSASCQGTAYTHISASVTLSNWSSNDLVQLMFIDQENDISVAKTATPASSIKVTATRPDNTDTITNAWGEICTVRLYINNNIIAECPVQRIGGIVDPILPTEYTLTVDTNGLQGVCLHNTATRTSTGNIDGYFAQMTDENGIAKITWNNTTGLSVNGSTPGTSASLYEGDTVYFYNTDTSSTSPVTSIRLQSMDQNVNF